MHNRILVYCKFQTDGPKLYVNMMPILDQLFQSGKRRAIKCLDLLPIGYELIP